MSDDPLSDERATGALTPQPLTAPHRPSEPEPASEPPAESAEPAVEDAHPQDVPAPIAQAEPPTEAEPGAEPEATTDADVAVDSGEVPAPDTAAPTQDAHLEVVSAPTGEAEPPTGPEAPRPGDARDDRETVPAPRPAPLAPRRRSLAAEVAHQLAAAGARYAFTVPGESFLPLIDALEEACIRVVVARHEGAAAFMAEAAAQLTGRPQVLLATRAVGASNAAIGLHTARQDSAPLVALVGQVTTTVRGREAFQEADLATGIGSLAAWSAEVTDPADASRLVGEGIRRLTHGRPGPILLALPEDLLEAEVTASPDDGRHTGPSGPSADRAAVRRVLRWLAASERGVILAGGGVLRARASKRLVALSEALAVPVVASWRRPDVFPNDHPHYLGMSGYWAAATVRRRLEEADVMLVLGSRLSEVSTFGYAIPGPGTRWAHVDLAPRPAQAGLAAPALSVAADASRFLDAAWSDLRGAALDAEMRSRREARIGLDREAWLAASEVSGGDWDGPGVHPGRVIATLERLLPPSAILTMDAGNFGGWAARGFRFRRPGTFAGPTSGAMGFGLPAAIAASLIHPDRPVVALCGDGGLAMTMAELETAVREGARPIVLVFDNESYGTIAMHQAREGRSTRTSALGPLDFAAVAQACGALGWRVDDDAALEPALLSALEQGRPAVLHLRLDRRWVSVDERP